jgi:hypothetical protein
LAFLSGLLLHVDGWVEFADDLLSNDLLDYVLKRNDAGETAVFIDDSKKVFAPLDELFEQLAGPSRFRYRVDGPTDLRKLDLVAAVGEDAEGVAAENHTDDVFTLVLVERHPAMDPASRLLSSLG